MKKSIALLCIHGIMGSPRQFDPLKAALSDVCEVIAPWLPGHGGDARDFARSSMQEWEGAVRQAAQAVFAQYDRVYFLGHSMGALLLTEYCLNMHRAKGLILVAMPLRFRYMPHALQNCLKVTFTSAPCLAREMCGVRPRPLTACIGWIPRYLELFRKAKDVKKRMAQLSTPAFCFFFERDELCSPRSIHSLPAGVKWQLLSGSWHSEWSEETYRRIAGAVRWGIERGYFHDL
ncbi:MAG: alpha/beta fold hydrolase [Clostridiales bacterium]|nr:alpha/beta fold hydrolase [Clostridiales bacterium]